MTSHLQLISQIILMDEVVIFMYTDRASAHGKSTVVMLLESQIDNTLACNVRNTGQTDAQGSTYLPIEVETNRVPGIVVEYGPWIING
ncbi:hypothetical protein JTE90_023068 [Oedothorax gibbosus]|uniref:Uncharacterized protein n=1 Tax=Oedothorax gibbosus TaxID=931172 RepID=A0AAV6UYC3_9ARAC|nr:hypothetical protein JTE90_023068 [Oedothorax gibbosus]